MLTNDDGYLAPGLGALYAALSKKHTVTVVAPDRERSAVGHSITINPGDDALCVQQTKTGYAVSGTPADCVKLGLIRLCPDADIVVSGINRGLNLGVDVHYSGTVSAAMEGAILGRPSIAFSAESAMVDHMDLLAPHCLDILQTYARNPFPEGMMLNVNLPQIQPGEALECAVAPLGFHNYKEVYDEEPAGHYRYRLGVDKFWRGENPVKDSELVYGPGKKILLTPLSWDMTAHGWLAQTKAVFGLAKTEDDENENSAHQ